MVGSYDEQAKAKCPVIRPGINVSLVRFSVLVGAVGFEPTTC